MNQEKPKKQLLKDRIKRLERTILDMQIVLINTDCKMQVLLDILKEKDLYDEALYQVKVRKLRSEKLEAINNGD
jgi:hypothetical protein